MIELVLVMVLVAVLAVFALPRFADLGGVGRTASAEYQASVLVARDTNNVNACRVGSSDCTDFVSTGEEACEEAMASFAPELSLDDWSVDNISSDTPRSEWADGLQEGQAIYWVTRFLGDNTSEHPDDDWFDTWNPRQPCIISREN